MFAVPSDQSVFSLMYRVTDVLIFYSERSIVNTEFTKNIVRIYLRFKKIFLSMTKKKIGFNVFT